MKAKQVMPVMRSGNSQGGDENASIFKVRVALAHGASAAAILIASIPVSGECADRRDSTADHALRSTKPAKSRQSIFNAGRVRSS